jgi:EmrB/QacA subfamily drug resistance transporter
MSAPDSAPRTDAASTDATPAAGDGGPTYPYSHRQILVIIAALRTGTLLGALDQTVVATALPTIVGELGSIDQLAWVVTAYLLASTASTAVYGPISDVYGRKRMYQFAIVVFVLGSVLCGLAQTMPQLIAARALQGIGGGGLLTLGFAIIGDVIPPRERGRYAGYFGAVFGLSSVAGPLVGGFFVDQLDWRGIFFINVPLGILALIATSKALRIQHVRRSHRIDLLGAGLLVAWTVAILIWLERGREWGWNSPLSLGVLLLGIALFMVFVRHEFRSEEPILPLRIFRNRVFSVAGACAFVGGVGLFGAILFLPIYLQIVKGLSPTQSGLQMLPIITGLLIGSIGSGRLITRWGRYRIFPIVGFALATIAMIALSRLESDTPAWQYMLAMLLLGIGFGNTTQVLVLAAQNAVEPRDIGVATSTATFMRQMGGTFGAAIFGTVLAGTLTSNLAAAFPQGPPKGVEASSITGSPAAIAALPDAVRSDVVEAFVDAVQVTFTVAVPILAVAFVLALFLREVRLKERGDAPQESTADAPTVG